MPLPISQNDRRSGQNAAALPTASATTAGKDGTLATPDPEQPAPPITNAVAQGKFLLSGFAILVTCLLAGEGLKKGLHLVLPGNILGLFILLALMSAGVVPLRWVEGAARWLLFLLPLLFVPIFVLALRKAVQLPQGFGYFSAVFCGVLLLWAVTGHLAQRLLSREPRSKSGSVSDPQ